MRNAIEVARCGSISSAAKKLYINQPNLSKSIKDMEKELGYTVFYRTPQGIKITQNGAFFLRHAYDILAKIELLNHFSDTPGTDLIALRLSGPRSTYLSHAFTEFLIEQQNKNIIQVEYSEADNAETITRLLNNEIDLGIIRIRVNDLDQYRSMLSESNLEYQIISKFYFMLVFSKHHPLAEKEKIFADDLLPHLKLTHPEMSNPAYAGVRMEKKEANRSIFIKDRSVQFHLLEVLQNSYSWCSPVPQDALDRFKLVQRRYDGESPLFMDLIIYHEEYMMTPPVIAYINKIKEVCNIVPGFEPM